MNLENHSTELIQNLVISLNNLSLRLLGVNDCDQASVAITEASDLLRKHAERHPAVYNLLFAMVLSNQSNVSLALGHQENALILVQEAVTLYREYPCVPHGFRCDCAKALRTLSGCLSNTGQHRDAVNLLLEAIQLNEKDNDTQAKLELAKSLDNLSSAYVNVHQMLLNVLLHCIKSWVFLFQIALDSQVPCIMSAKGAFGHKTSSNA
ncbi:hypothetical protein K435DRAFT_879069 [Dendrothele bispora CBS 962.96]|uniref:TPR-like protein n=1 Tax=Dendrothele bispora (strain CBS 962.96) TaxID=1314807 RepID=A0A4S8KLR8_DENBC|nr:hypothetical protein K435DRAFT_879069 [Dendrothele bispora CBS 962.96]